MFVFHCSVRNPSVVVGKIYSFRYGVELVLASAFPVIRLISQCKIPDLRNKRRPYLVYEIYIKLSQGSAVVRALTSKADCSGFVSI